MSFFESFVFFVVQVAGKNGERPMEKSSRRLQILNAVTIGLLIIATGLVFLYAPTERTMGQVQRVFYFHVSSAWVGLFAFFVTLVTSIVYLRTGSARWDRIGLSSVEIGLVFTVMTAASGSIWARPAWNTWWTWDPRLTTYTIMALIYVAYLMLRQGLEDPQRRARFASVYGIVGFISVPITFFSIRWWRTIHPVVVGSGGESAQGTFAMTSPMLVTLLFSVATFTVLYFCLLANRVRLEQLAERVEQLKARVWSA
jgi:heme exporter protein C